MFSDLAALTPPLIVSAAFLVGVVMFLRRQMSPRRSEDDDRPADIDADGINEFGGPREAAADSEVGSVSDPRHSSGA